MNKSDLKNYLKTSFPHTSSFRSGFSLFLVDSFVLLFSIGFVFSV